MLIIAIISMNIVAITNSDNVIPEEAKLVDFTTYRAIVRLVLTIKIFSDLLLEKAFSFFLMIFLLIIITNYSNMQLYTGLMLSNSDGIIMYYGSKLRPLEYAYFGISWALLATLFTCILDKIRLKYEIKY